MIQGKLRTSERQGQFCLRARARTTTIKTEILERPWSRQCLSTFCVRVQHFRHNSYVTRIGCTENRPKTLTTTWEIIRIYAYRNSRWLTHLGRGKMAAIFLTAFSWMKMYQFWLLFHWSLFSGVPDNNIQTLVQIMAWRRPGAKPLSEPMMVCSIDAYMCNSPSMS